MEQRGPRAHRVQNVFRGTRGKRVGHRGGVLPARQSGPERAAPRRHATARPRREAASRAWAARAPWPGPLRPAGRTPWDHCRAAPCHCVSLRINTSTGSVHSRLAGLLPVGMLLDLASSDALGGVALGFVTPDRSRARYSLRMRETSTEPRAEVIDRVTARVQAAGLQADVVAGLYDLQAQLGRLLASSLRTGIGGLLALFIGVAWVVARSGLVAGAMWACLGAIPSRARTSPRFCHSMLARPSQRSRAGPGARAPGPRGSPPLPGRPAKP